LRFFRSLIPGERARLKTPWWAPIAMVLVLPLVEPLPVLELLPALEFLPAPLHIFCFPSILEFLTRVAMFAAWAPVAPAGFSSRAAVSPSTRTVRPLAFASWALELLRSRPPLRLRIATRALRRVPEFPAGEPFHLGIGMLFLDAAERGLQFLAIGGAKSRWQAAGNDRPVGVTRWHRRLLNRVRGV
jgi:hypothetical protein